MSLLSSCLPNFLSLTRESPSPLRQYPLSSMIWLTTSCLISSSNSMFPTQYLMLHQHGTSYSPTDTPCHFLSIYLYRCSPIYLIHPSLPSSCSYLPTPRGSSIYPPRGKNHQLESFYFSFFYNKIIPKTLTYDMHKVGTRDWFLALLSFFRGFKPLIRLSSFFL